MPEKYYNGVKLLSLKDLNGADPEIFLCTSNRSAGKTTFFSRYLVNRFLKHGEKFALLYRFNYELDDISEKFFKDINALFFPGYTMTSKRQAAGIYHELFLEFPDNTDESQDIESCGYAITLNSADQLKKYSHLFSDVSRIFFDEFQSETGHYCNNEIKKFQSIHTTIARGAGAQARRVPVIMCSNPVSIINPYYMALGIASRLQRNTHFLRGWGWVLEQGYNESAAAAVASSGFMSAFVDTSYRDYATNARYLIDRDAFISKEPENGRYILTFKFQDKNYSIKELSEAGFLYISDSFDASFPFRLAVDLSDHSINYVMLSHNDGLIKKLRFMLEHGNIRFKNQLCKNAFIALVGYNYLVSR